MRARTVPSHLAVCRRPWWVLRLSLVKAAVSNDRSQEEGR
eukprot:COSAG01_NODE_14353_length_1465_cov_1.131040_2_plen_39_part_01